MFSQNLVVIGPKGCVPVDPSVAGAQSWRVLRLDGPSDTHTPWRAAAPELLASAAKWADCRFVLVLSEDVSMSGEDVSELFRLMQQHHLVMAQPSLSWSGHAVDITARHNQSFVFRRTSRVDPAALAMSSQQFREMLPLMAALPDPVLLSRLLPACLPDPLSGAAVVDAVQATRLTPPREEELGAPVWPEGLLRPGCHREESLSWGGQVESGVTLGLFDDSRCAFLGHLATGLAARLEGAEVLGRLFLDHLSRSKGQLPESIQTVDKSAEPASVSFWGRLRSSPICSGP